MSSACTDAGTVSAPGTAAGIVGAAPGDTVRNTPYAEAHKRCYKSRLKGWRRKIGASLCLFQPICVHVFKFVIRTDLLQIT